MDREQAQILIKQLGNKTLVMIGAKNLADGEKGLGFKIGRNSKRINYIQIQLNGLDLYDMTFKWVSVKGVKVQVECHNVYDDMLCKMIEKWTGLYTSMGTMGS